MIILKLVAWSDRPEKRADDLPDILKIIEHYFDLEFDDIVEFHHDTFSEDEAIDRYRVAAEVIGRKASVYLDKSERLAKRIHKLMEVNLMIESESAIAKVWARKKDWTIAYAFSILQAFQKGLLNKRN